MTLLDLAPALRTAVKYTLYISGTITHNAVSLGASTTSHQVRNLTEIAHVESPEQKKTPLMMEHV